MAIPIIVGAIAGASAIYGAVKGVSGAIDQSDAKDMNKDARLIVSRAEASLDEQRESTNAIIENYGARKLRAYETGLANFLNVFQQIKSIDFSEVKNIEGFENVSFQENLVIDLRRDHDLLVSSGTGIAAGATGGAALAFGAYSGTMMLATASTGTAISTLSGAAATNATLAWLGGGSLATGGLGIAGGTMVLGGIVAGPALAIFGHMIGNKGEEALNDARANRETALTYKEESDLQIEKLQAIAKVTSLADKTLSSLSTHLRRAVRNLSDIVDVKGNNYGSFNDEDKASVFASVKYAQLIKAMIDTPILDEQGNLILSTEKNIQDIAGAI